MKTPLLIKQGLIALILCFSSGASASNAGAMSLFEALFIYSYALNSDINKTLAEKRVQAKALIDRIWPDVSAKLLPEITEQMLVDALLVFQDTHIMDRYPRTSEEGKQFRLILRSMYKLDAPPQTRIVKNIKS